MADMARKLVEAVKRTRHKVDRLARLTKDAHDRKARSDHQRSLDDEEEEALRDEIRKMKETYAYEDEDIDNESYKATRERDRRKHEESERERDTDMSKEREIEEEMIERRESERQLSEDTDNMKLRDIEKQRALDEEGGGSMSTRTPSAVESLRKMEEEGIRERAIERERARSVDRKVLAEADDYSKRKGSEERREGNPNNPYTIQGSGDGGEGHSRTHRKGRQAYCDAVQQRTNVYVI